MTAYLSMAPTLSLLRSRRNRGCKRFCNVGIGQSTACMTCTTTSSTFCDSMLATAFRRYCIKPQWTQRGHCSASKTTTAVSLSQAARNADTVETLNLEDSPDLLCVNLMCEKVGDPCICRLSRVLEKLHHLQGLNLSGNKLISLPESIGQLERLQYLDLSNNNLQTLPNTMQHLKQLQVLNLKGNPQLVSISELHHLHSLKQLHVDDELAIALPAELRRLAK